MHKTERPNYSFCHTEPVPLLSISQSQTGWVSLQCPFQCTSIVRQDQAGPALSPACSFGAALRLVSTAVFFPICSRLCQAVSQQSWLPQFPDISWLFTYPRAYCFSPKKHVKVWPFDCDDFTLKMPCIFLTLLNIWISHLSVCLGCQMHFTALVVTFCSPK